VSKLLFIPFVLVAVAAGSYWLNTNSEVKNPAVEQAYFSPTTKLENSSVEAVPVSRESSEPNQAQAAYSKPIDTTGNAEPTTSHSFIGVDEYSYQRENSHSINVGELKNPDDISYQRDDREVINVGEIMDTEILDSIY
jgi:hypothetical protein